MTSLRPRPFATPRIPHAPMFLRVLICVATLLLVSSAGGCDRDRTLANELVVTGSTTILPIAEIAADMYSEVHPGQRVLVSGLGSSAGIETVASGSSDVGTSSRDLKPAEEALGLQDIPIAYDAIAVIVNPDNPVGELTTDQIRAIFAGEIDNWSEVGGLDMEIGLVNRDEASGTREAFQRIVMDDTPFDRTAAVLPGTGQVRSVVANSRGAVGYISLGFVNDEVQVVAIDGVFPTIESVLIGEYPLQRLLHFFTLGEPTDLAEAYIDFVLSEEIQSTIVKDAGFIPIVGKVQ